MSRPLQAIVGLFLLTATFVLIVHYVVVPARQYERRERCVSEAYGHVDRQECYTRYPL